MRLGLIVVAALVLGGCHLPGMDGPVSRSLASSRQLSQQGVSAIERGQWDKAETLLAEAVEACPANPDARRSYAEALWNRGSREAALVQLTEVGRIAPEDATIHVRLAEMRLAVEQHAQAMESARRAIDLDPKSASAWAVQARILRAGQHLNEALACYHRALGYCPDDRSIQFEVAQVYRQLGQPQRALVVLQTLADSYAPGEEPQQVLALEGSTYLALGRYDDAVETLQTAVVRERPTSELFFQLAEAQWRAGRAGDAAISARQSLSLDSQYQPSQQLLQQLELAEAPSSVVRR